MMKKLIIFFCGTLALTACGNGIEKKANEKLTIARAAYERGDYEEAKTQIDSIKILYPKAFEARKAGQELMRNSRLNKRFWPFWTVLSRQSKQRLTPSKASTPWRKMPNISKWVTTYGLHKPSRRISIVPSFASK